MKLQQLYIGAYLFGAVWLISWEISAFIIGRTDLTISDMTWQLEGPGYSFARYVIAMSLIWLTFHLSLGWFR